MNSMLGYPLYYELIRVFAQGLPPAALEYRLEAMMEVYPTRFLFPTLSTTMTHHGSWPPGALLP